MLEKLIENLNRYKLFIILTIIFLVFFILMLNSAKYGKISSIQNKATSVINAISEKIINKENISEKEKNEIEKLKEENSKLREELVKNRINSDDIEKLESLKKSLKFIPDKNKDNFISSYIVAKNSGTFYTNFTISAGEVDGVKKDSIVVNGDGLIGRVYEVSKNYSKAISIIDNKSPISFEISGRDSDTGMLSQDTKNMQIDNTSMIKGYMFDANSKVKVGEIVTTSGLGLYPKGIPIGTINQVIPDEQNILKYVVVKPYVDLKNINKVILFNKIEVN